MAREGTKTEISSGFVNRVVGGLRYAVLGDTSWFGPAAPPAPVAPPETEGRQWDYPTHYNLHTRPRQSEAISFEELRALADGYDLLRLVIETRKDQLAKLNHSVGFRQKPGENLRRPPDERCVELEELLRRPDRRHGWATWLRMVLEDLFVIDAPAIYVRRDMAGGIYGLEPIDGSSIKVVLSEDGRTPRSPEPAYQQILKGLPAVDYTTEELVYFPRNPRAHKAYGYSMVEQVIMTVNIAIRRQIHQLQHYSEGNIPEALAGVPEDWTPEQISQFQAYWDSLLEGDTAERRHMKFIPGQLSLQFTKDPQLKDDYDEWLARVICYAFSVPPLPFVKEQNRATAQTAKDAALEEGLAPLMNWIKDLMDHVIQDLFGYHDLEFMWADERDLDPATQSQVDIAEIRMGLKSMDEVRANNGDDPIGMGHAIFGVGPLGVIFIEDINTPEKREAMMQKMQGGPEGMMGDPFGGMSPEMLQAMGVDDPVVAEALMAPTAPPPPNDASDPVVAEALGITPEDLASLPSPMADPSSPEGLAAFAERYINDPSEPPPPPDPGDPVVEEAVLRGGMEPGDAPPNRNLQAFIEQYLRAPSEPPPQPDPNDPVVEAAMAGEIPDQPEAQGAPRELDRGVEAPGELQDPGVGEQLQREFEAQASPRQIDPVVAEALSRQRPLQTKNDPAVRFRQGWNR